MITKKCLQCGVIFTTYDYLEFKQIFCSAKCRQESQKILFSGKNNPFYGKKHTDITKEKLRQISLGKKHTEETKKKIGLGNKGKKRTIETRMKMRLSNRKLSDEGRRILSENMKKNNPVKRKEVRDKISKTLTGVPQPWNRGCKCNLWKGGISSPNKMARQSIAYKTFIRKVYKRDNYICRKCNMVNRFLNVHHIKNFSKHKKLRTSVSNGITLCLKCHRAFHRKYGVKNNTIYQLKEFLR